MLKVGFIGAGNMGAALAEGVGKCGLATEIYISNRTKEKAVSVAKKTGAVATDNKTVASKCDIVFLAVKPNVIRAVADEIKDILSAKENVLVITMAAGIGMEKISSFLGFDCPIIRIMPNTPVSIGEGMTLWCANEHVSGEQKATFEKLLEKSGKTDEISEVLMDAGSAVSGCGPAFAYMFIEALADGAVECGLPRSKAIGYAAQMLIGSARMVIESGEHPEKLKDAVCSPGGSTIAGVRALEEGAFRACAINAVKASFDKTKILGNS
ncbi:MAG: pyrroline-5-carboxylate reductase [Eubacterium sp.]|nr:pyrroline-5-carboxylate reductase [Eubacterium sp.]